MEAGVGTGWGMSKLAWYWHRLRAMHAAEWVRRARQLGMGQIDAWRGGPVMEGTLIERAGFSLPPPASAPPGLRRSLETDIARILAGDWRAFGSVPCRVTDPPAWQADLIAGVDLRTNKHAFRLNHRQLPRGADIKVLWEWSRWYQLTRLALGAYVTGSEPAGRKCLEWLRDWLDNNPCYRGWNWTSALEAGLRLAQFSWMDRCLSAAAASVDWKPELERLAGRVIPGHVRFAWRHRSYGSSANNHLMGELAGLIMAQARWPESERWSAPLDRLQGMWEDAVLRQFAEDGGHCEQALNYHLFTWQLCWLTRGALLGMGREVKTETTERLEGAADFFASVQVERDPWDYGDSDGAGAMWLGEEEGAAASEWMAWLDRGAPGVALQYWLGDPPAPAAAPLVVRLDADWLHYPISGQLVCWDERWRLRLDASPLGYLSTAAHGHLDALHLSIWVNDAALVVDPGTGAYYADPTLRAYLASWEAHNGPHPTGLDYPRRLGSFLWSEHHARPVVRKEPEGGCQVSLDLPSGRARRCVRRTADRDGWQIDDQYLPHQDRDEPDFMVVWQFAPGTELERVHERRYRAKRDGVTVVVGLDAAWSDVEEVRPKPEPERLGSGWIGSGVCAPGFRRIATGPQLRLRALVHNPCFFRTTFLSSADS